MTIYNAQPVPISPNSGTEQHSWKPVFCHLLAEGMDTL